MREPTKDGHHLSGGVHLKRIIMKCYTDFFIHYCPYCGKPIEIEQEDGEFSHQDYLHGKTLICSCGMKYQYLPEHKFPSIRENNLSAIA